MIVELSLAEIKKYLESGKTVAVLPPKESNEHKYPKGDLRRWLFLQKEEVCYIFFPFGPQSDGQAKRLHGCNRYGGEKYNCYIIA